MARVAERRGIPYTLSTMGTTSIEDVAAAAPDARKWFQLYVWKDRAAGENLMGRAKAAGFEALVLTVDVPVAGARLRDARNGFAIPPALTVKTVLDMSLRPAWWMNLLTTKPLTFASLHSWQGTIAELLDELFDPSTTLADLEWLRGSWDGPLVIKGVETVSDAVRMVEAGADAIVLSNHGGRQLDRAPVPLRLLPDVVDKIGADAEVWIDTGIVSGADIVAAIALGANATMVGRAYLYGLMAGGERGVDRAAEIRAGEVRRTMALLGVSRVDPLSLGRTRSPETRSSQAESHVVGRRDGSAESSLVAAIEPPRQPPRAYAEQLYADGHSLGRHRFMPVPPITHAWCGHAARRSTSTC